MAWTWQWKVWNQLTNAHVLAFRLSGGRLGGSLNGAPVLLLHHTGRRSGKERVNPLTYLRDGADMVIVASKGGSHKHPAWFLNLREMSETAVEVRGATRRVKVHVASPPERERLWPEVVALYPGYADYQRRTKREIPLVVLSPAD
jgi:F420H(2)-dependent quinone reductase